MEPKNDRAPFDWYNYVGALLRGTLVAAVANATVIMLASPLLSPIPLPEITFVAILGFFVKSIFTMAFGFLFFLVPSSLIALVATFVFGSGILLMVRRTRFLTVVTFAVAGFAFGYMMLIAFAYSTNAGVNFEALFFSLVGGIAGLAGGWAFGHRICHPVSKEARFSGYSR